MDVFFFGWMVGMCAGVGIGIILGAHYGRGSDMSAVWLWWMVGIFAVAFVVVLGVEALLSAAGDEDDWWKTKEAWVQPLVAGGIAAGIVFLVWALLKALGVGV